ncbi:MAG TPA: RDD family protein [Candidatus Coprousia avicola]|nr:RDD family protein [Candidatus Coprousia avicola]
MGKKSRKARRAQRARAAAAPRAHAPEAPAPVAASRWDHGIRLALRRLMAGAIDFAVPAGLVSVFYWCAAVFYLDPATVSQGHLMLVCAVATVGLLTVALPRRYGGRTLGGLVCSLRIENIDGTERTCLQLFARECVLKVAAGPFLCVFCLLDYVVLGMAVHRDFEPRLLLDYFCKTRVVSVRR